MLSDVRNALVAPGSLASAESVASPRSSRLPPFPPAPPGSRLRPFKEKPVAGLILDQRTGRLRSRCAAGLQTMSLVSLIECVQYETARGRLPPPAKPKVATRKDGLVCVPTEDAWKIGDPDERWEEPGGTSITMYELCVWSFFLLPVRSLNTELIRRSRVVSPSCIQHLLACLRDILTGSYSPRGGSRLLSFPADSSLLQKKQIIVRPSKSPRPSLKLTLDA